MSGLDSPIGMAGVILAFLVFGIYQCSTGGIKSEPIEDLKPKTSILEKHERKIIDYVFEKIKADK